MAGHRRLSGPALKWIQTSADRVRSWPTTKRRQWPGGATAQSGGSVATTALAVETVVGSRG
jgi:hypothetical protein